MRRQTSRRLLLQTANINNNSNNNSNNNNSIENTFNYIDEDSIDESSTVLFVTYNGHSRKLFRIVCYNLKRNSFDAIASSNPNSPTANNQNPSKHKLLAKLHNTFLQNLEYGIVCLTKENTYQLFLKFEKEMEPNLVKSIVSNKFGELGFTADITFIIVKSEDDTVKDMSKIDTSMVHSSTVRETMFSKHWRKFRFFNDCPKLINNNHTYITDFCTTDAAKSSLWQSWRSWQMDTIKLRPHYLIYEGDYSGWQLQVVKWFNMHTMKTTWIRKTPQLYLHGTSNVGKSSFIDLILAPYKDQTFIPVHSTNTETTRFQWEGFHEKLFNVVLYDEFDFREINLNNWKMVADGSQFKQDIKFINAGENIQIRCPFVMISNYGPLDFCTKDEDRAAIQSRILQVEASPFPGDKNYLNPSFKVRYCKSIASMYFPLTLEELEKELESDRLQALASNSIASPQNSSTPQQETRNNQYAAASTSGLNQVLTPPRLSQPNSPHNNNPTNSSFLKYRLREKILNSPNSSQVESSQSTENSLIYENNDLSGVNINQIELTDDDYTNEYEFFQNILNKNESMNQNETDDVTE